MKSFDYFLILILVINCLGFLMASYGWLKVAMIADGLLIHSGQYKFRGKVNFWLIVGITGLLFYRLGG